MIVFLGATFAWLLAATLLGVGIFLMTVKGMYWPFIVVFILLFWLIKRVGCSTH